jgi:hypothetical protein
MSEQPQSYPFPGFEAEAPGIVELVNAGIAWSNLVAGDQPRAPAEPLPVPPSDSEAAG